MDRPKHSVIAFGLVLVVAGCAGSGSMSLMPSAAPEHRLPGSEEALKHSYAVHPEFRNQYGLAQVKAHHAYARGATGKGVTLGIVDTGVDPNHPKFEGRLDASNVEGYTPDFENCNNRAPDGTCLSLIGHGTFVAGIMAAGRRNTSNPGRGSAAAIHGVAFDADVVSVGFASLDEILEDILGENPTPEQVRDLPDLVHRIESRLERQFASAFEGLNGRVTAVNASFGLPGNIEDFDAKALRERFPNVIETVAQADTPAGERTVYVWAAGNSNSEINPDGSMVSATSVDITAGLPVWIPELRGHSLAVVATDRQGRIAGFSSRCGIAKAFCLAAPGVDITGPVPDFYCPTGTSECYLTFEEAGTSSATPFVTGGIGLLAQHYRNQLGNDKIVKRLLATADKTGEYADSEVYGQGFLDLDAATRPVGRTRILTGRSLAGPSVFSDASIFHLGGAFGDSLARGLARSEVASFDALDAPFFRPLGGYLRQNRLVAPSLSSRLRTLGRDPRGATWHSGASDFRLRLDAAPTSHGVRTGSGFHGEADGSGPLGSLSFAQDVGNGRLSFGYRAHPGWRFGLHATGGMADRRFAAIEPGTFTDDSAFANPFLGFARNGISIGYAAGAGPGAFHVAAFQGTAGHGERRDNDAGEAMGVLTEYQLNDTGLAFQAGWFAEAEAAVGNRASGAFGTLTSDSVIMGLSASRRLGDGWNLLANAYTGMTHVEISRRGMVQDMSGLWSGSFDVGLIGKEMGHVGGRLALRLSQPLRVEAGQARLQWVSGRTPDGEVALEGATLDLMPSGRQIDLELTYSHPWAGGQAFLAGIVSHDAGHVRGEREAALMMYYSRLF